MDLWDIIIHLFSPLPPSTPIVSGSIISRAPPLRNLRRPSLQLTYYVGCRDIVVFELRDYDEIIPNDEEQM